MSPRFARDGAAADHERARDLAATRLGEALHVGDVAWLEDHLAGCGDCAAAAAEYEEQRRSLQAFRLDFPEPPRDLWARTSAAIEAEGAARSWRSGWRSRGLPLVPVAGLMVIAIAVGMGLLNGRSLFPDGTRTGDGPMPTPINVAAAEVEVLSRASDGTMQILTRRLTQVCPMGADACGLAPSFDVMTTATISGSADLAAIISPGRDRMVVVDRGEGAGGVYVVTMAQSTSAPAASPAASPTPDPGDSGPAASPAASPTPDPGDSGQPATTVPGDSGRAATPDTGLETASPAETPHTATPSASPGNDAATPDPSATPVPATPDPSATPAPATPVATPGTGEQPTPSIVVAPAPDGALEIARDVIVLGGIAAYSADGARFAFTARPADGSTGPDVYVWTVGDAEAHAVTTNHASVFSGWLDGNLLVSRVADGKPETVLLDLDDGTETAVSAGRTWRPAIGPRGRTAVWWDGAVTLDGDGLIPVPGAGRLVLAPWPEDSPNPQVLATGPLTDWDVHWDAAGTVLAVWTTAGKPGEAGLLRLYAVDADTGRADLDHPLMDATAAFGGFSLKPGRLAWSAPAEDGEVRVSVAAWSGRDVGRLDLPAEQGVTIIR